MSSKLPSLVQPFDYYPLLLFHVGGDEDATHCPRTIKRDFRALGWLVRESGAKVTFSSLLPAAGRDTGKNRLFRMDRRGRRGGGFALYMKKWTVSRAVSEEQRRASQNPVSKNQRPVQQREPCGSCLLQAA